MAKSRKKTSASRAQKADQPGNTNSAQKMGKPQEKQKTEVTSEPMKAPAAEAPAAETQAAPQAADAAPQAQASETQKPVKKSRPAKEKIFREKSIEPASHRVLLDCKLFFVIHCFHHFHHFLRRIHRVVQRWRTADDVCLKEGWFAGVHCSTPPLLE